MSDEKSLEEKVKEETKKPGLANLIFHSGLASAATAASYLAVGINGPLTAAAFAGGKIILNTIKKKKHSLTELMQEVSVGSILGAFGSYTYTLADKFIPNIDLAGKLYRAAANILVGNPLFTGLYLHVDSLVKNGPSLSKAYNNFKENFWETLKSTTLWLGVPLGLTVNGYMGGYPGIVACDAGYRIVAGDPEPKKQEQKAAQPQPAQPHTMRNAA